MEVHKYQERNIMNKIEVEIPQNVEQVTNATTGVVACLVMLVAGVLKGMLAAIKFAFGGIFRIAAGAVAGGCAAAVAKPGDQAK